MKTEAIELTPEIFVSFETVYEAYGLQSPERRSNLLHWLIRHLAPLLSVRKMAHCFCFGALHVLVSARYGTDVTEALVARSEMVLCGFQIIFQDLATFALSF